VGKSKEFLIIIRDKIFLNKPILYALLLIALLVINFLISIFFVVFRFLKIGSLIYRISYSGGWIVLTTLVMWTLIFFHRKKTIERTQNNPPIQICPACQNALDKIINITNSKVLLPNADAVYSCEVCNTKIHSNFPFQKWYFDEIGIGNNPDIKWLYSQEFVSKPELIGISKGKHTEEAIRKLRNRSFSRISKGDFNELHNIKREWLAPSDSNKYFFSDFPQNYSYLDKPSSRLLLVIHDVNLGRISTKENKPYLKVVESGTFYMTIGKFGLFGKSKSYENNYRHLSNLKTGDKKIEVWLSGRKLPDYYLNLDEELVKAVFEGIKNENP
jgi:hypothetical protein